MLLGNIGLGKMNSSLVSSVVVIGLVSIVFVMMLVVDCLLLDRFLVRLCLRLSVVISLYSLIIISVEVKWLSVLVL